MADVRFDSVTKSFGSQTVIEDLRLEIRDHEFMVLVGPSGCGKSTALRMIAGLEAVTSGDIYIGERRVTDLAPRDRDVAMVFQSYALYPHMSVRQNIEFGLRIRKTPKDEVDRKVRDAAVILGIDNLLDRKPKQLSGGQRQRVAVARAIVRDPQVFLFDEPLSNLDAKLRVQMRAEITRLQQRLQTTCVYVTHDQVEAMTMGQRIAVMKDGRLQQVGTPLEVYDRPASVFVAQFIGTPPMNLFEARVAGDVLDAGAFRLPLPAAFRSAVRDGMSVRAGIRPENLLPAGKEARSDAATIATSVDFVEAVGHQSVVHVRAGEIGLTALFDPHAAPRMGESTTLTAELDRLHLFDATNELRLA